MEQFLAALPLLACPVGMGVMMWWMSRNRHADDARPATDQATEVARLRTELNQLRAEHEARTQVAEQKTGGNP